MRLSVLAALMGGVVTPVTLLLVVGVCWAGQSVTQPSLRAAFLYSFAKFTDWGADAVLSGPLRICVLGIPDRQRIASILDELQGAAVLTVSNGYEFVRLVSIVGLFVDEGRMRFAINPEAAQHAGLRLSSRLLQLAKILKDDRHDTP